MKKVLIILILSLVYLTPAICSLDVSVYKVGPKSFAISVDQSFGKALDVTIQEFHGDIVYREKTSPDYLERRQYNLRNLPEGQYKVRIQSSLKAVVHSVLIQNNEMHIEQKEEVVYFIPQLTQKEDRLDINFLSLTPTKIFITMYDEQGQAVIDESESVNMRFGRRYDLSSLAQGSYRVHLTVNDGIASQIYSHNIILQ